MKKQAFNPYVPSWEYVPDGEPHVFGDRVYVYGSHDFFNGCVFCLGEYVCYSAPVNDLSDWKYEGVIYKRNDDPINDGMMVLYAPDVTQGPDGRYYLYYVLDKSVLFLLLSAILRPVNTNFTVTFTTKTEHVLAKNPVMNLSLTRQLLQKEIQHIFIQVSAVII